MDTVYYLGKIGELSLKKGNKKFFENRLSENLRILLDGKKQKFGFVQGDLRLKLVCKTVKLASGRCLICSE